MEKKPEWLKVRYSQEAVAEVAKLMRDLNLNTVCKEANCPNLGECYRQHTATFMILGSVCTRNCRFCNVTTGHPLPPDPEEPMNVARAAKKLGLRHVVLTCFTRDDLPVPMAPEEFKAHMIRCIMGGSGAAYEVTAEDDARIRQIAVEKFDSWEHTYGADPKFNMERTSRFEGSRRVLFPYSVCSFLRYAMT
ncbi:hypothetical protein [uncultured Dysosmobacter sp.]|uniref:hypothetical protein n=1 Tax=uncultured Dysosmobacter sp. TaxID=2591384 RepID=UPI00345D4BA8